MLLRLYRLVHDITPCEDLPSFEGLLSSSVSDSPFANREPTIVEETSTTTAGTASACVATSQEVGLDPVTQFKKPPERKRRKLPEIPKIYQS